MNALVGRPGLARVSGSPGKTTLLNFYRLPSLYLVDLPGLRLCPGQQDRPGRLSQADHTAISGPAHTLAGVVWLLDIRHPPSTEDREMQELLIESGRPVLAVLTKADKLTRSAAAVRARELAADLGLHDDQVQLTSSSVRQGIAELGQSILSHPGEHP